MSGRMIPDAFVDLELKRRAGERVSDKEVELLTEYRVEFREFLPDDEDPLHFAWEERVPRSHLGPEERLMVLLLPGLPVGSWSWLADPLERDAWLHAGSDGRYEFAFPFGEGDGPFTVTWG